MAFLLAALDARAANIRRTVVISDTHFGPGMQNGMWHPYEDFRWTDDLATFIADLERDGVPTDLVLNGDTFELWQSEETDCFYGDANLGCTEEDALRRLEGILRGHVRDIEVLRDFTFSGDHCIYIVPGNHDAALLYPKVAATAIGAFSSPDNRVMVTAAGYWVSVDGLIVAAHGQQIDDVNRFDEWPDHVFLRAPDGLHLQRPWGEQFVQQFFNEIERRYPIIDNIAGEANGVRYGLAAEGLRRSVVDAAKFVKFFLADVSRQQAAQVLHTSDEDSNASSDEQHAEAAREWNAALVKTEEKAMFFARSLPRDDSERPAVEAAVRAGLFDDAIKNIADQEIVDICIQRANLRERGFDVDLCPQSFLHAGVQAVFLKTPQRIFDELRAMHDKAGAGSPPFAIAVFGHTHKAQDMMPLTVSDQRWKTELFNSGAWQRIAQFETVEKLRINAHLSIKEVLRRLQPEDLPACYPFVVIEPYSSGTPKASLRHWIGTTMRAENGRCAD